MSDDRKKDHIALALDSQTKVGNLDIYYEPLFSAHPNEETDISLKFLGKIFKAPFWISSMTGGTEKAFHLNTNLAKVAGEFGIGMGLGSCRPILENQKERFKDFKLRELIGGNAFYTNLGIAQLEDICFKGEFDKLSKLQSELEADGLIIHLNPLQEWSQPEGDRYRQAPLLTIKSILEHTDIPVIVKEVGQGFGPNSLLALMQLPLQAIDFASFGGTNFTLLEQTRHIAQGSAKTLQNKILTQLGHTKEEMITWANQYIDAQGIKCKNFIISGGVQSSVEGFILQQKLMAPSLIGMAGQFLKYAHDYGELRAFVENEINNYKLATCFLRGK